MPLMPLFSPVLHTTRPYSQTKSNTQRALMLPDEVLRLPNEQAIVFLRGQKPLLLYKIIPDELPAYEKLKSVKIADYQPEWRQMEAKLKARPEAKPDLTGDIFKPKTKPSLADDFFKTDVKPGLSEVEPMECVKPLILESVEPMPSKPPVPKIDFAVDEYEEEIVLDDTDITDVGETAETDDVKDSAGVSDSGEPDTSDAGEPADTYDDIEDTETDVIGIVVEASHDE